MKKQLLFFFVIGFSAMNAQEISEYHLIGVPKNFTSFKGNQYNLRKVLISKLQDKNFKIIDENTDAIDQNACNILNADVKNTSGMLKNKITVLLKDCRGNEVFKNEGMSMEKEFETGYPEALINALKKLPQSSGKDDILLNPAGKAVPTPEPELPKQKNTEVKSTQEKVENKTISLALVYMNKNVKYQKVNLAPGQFIFTSANSSSPFATFLESGKAGVFHVKLENGIQTLAYFEGNDLVIEIPQSDGNYRQEKFSAQ